VRCRATRSDTAGLDLGDGLGQSTALGVLRLSSGPDALFGDLADVGIAELHVSLTGTGETGLGQSADVLADHAVNPPMAGVAERQQVGFVVGAILGAGDEVVVFKAICATTRTAEFQNQIKWLQ
jgi:hypothetical protein